VDVSQCSPDLDLGVGRRTGLGPRRRACTDIRSYLAERAGNINKRSTSKVSECGHKYGRSVKIRNIELTLQVKSDYFNLITHKTIDSFGIKIQKY
jgi:hypothetical protein